MRRSRRTRASRVSVTPAGDGRGDEVTVGADRDRLRQVFANLLDNALKYTPAGGQVAITLEKRDDGGAVIFRDTGIGITPEDLPRIWDRLYRGDRSRAERGLGLGLSLVRAYVRAHGGQVFAESTPGQGSTFAVLLPEGAGTHWLRADSGAKPTFHRCNPPFTVQQGQPSSYSIDSKESGLDRKAATARHGGAPRRR